ncbi:hypothetical protein HZF05_00475 [Sphingomonas sp. CGMCC 1.13654]|uniref:TonB-dependent receptor n=1 Tax=Sphingomonas chungangi TaxID=2683589 RepID=A0A838L2V0_9SPHN|nr:hypothetical protein [Sphingomonas chungangi]MBA2932556.1 hypothetical protein [Sphingomonas chungangi]MVW56179.1 hypothetical protein [Sphingomonas chungangi]
MRSQPDGTCDDDGACVEGSGEDLNELFYRQQNARFRGMEGQASYALLKHGDSRFEINALGNYTRATLDQDGNVSRIVPYRLGGRFIWKSGMLDAKLLYLHVGRQDKYGAFDTPTPLDRCAAGPIRTSSSRSSAGTWPTTSRARRPHSTRTR